MEKRITNKAVQKKTGMNLAGCFNNRRGYVTAAIYGILGLVFALAVFSADTVPLPAAPGLYILLFFMSGWEIGHGGIILILMTNPLLYAVAGYVVGGFSRSRRQVICITGALAVILLFSSVCVHVVRPYVKNRHSIKQTTQRLTDKLAADPNDVTALFCMGIHRFGSLDDTMLAKESFLRVVELEEFGGKFSPYVQRSFLYLALICQARQEQDQAESYYKEFLATEPDLQNDRVLLNLNRRYLRRQGQSQQVKL